MWCQPEGTIRWATLQVVAGSTFAYKRGAREPFLHSANKHSNHEPTGLTVLYFDSNILVRWDGGNGCSPRGSSTHHPCQDGKWRDRWSGKRSNVLIYLTTGACEASPIVKVALAENCGKIPDKAGSWWFGAFGRVRGGAVHQRGKRRRGREDDGWRTGSPNQKRPREAGYKVDDDDSDASLHPNLKKPKQYIVVSKEEDDSGKPEDDMDQNPNYNPFFN